MRIPHSEGAIHINPDLGERLLADAVRLFGGETFIDGGGLIYESDDELVAGWSGMNPELDSGRADSGLAFSQLSDPAQARRWTAMQAYLAKTDRQSIVELSLEVPGTLAAKEVNGRKSKGEDVALHAVSHTAEREEGYDRSILVVTGADLVDAAFSFAAAHEKLVYHTENSDRLVARALGAPSLGVLGRTWELSQKTSGPLVAACFVLNNLGLAID